MPAGKGHLSPASSCLAVNPTTLRECVESGEGLNRPLYITGIVVFIPVSQSSEHVAFIQRRINVDVYVASTLMRRCINVM